MEIFVRLPKELREKVLRSMIRDDKEEAERVGVDAAALEVEIDDVVSLEYPVSYMLKYVLGDVKELCKINDDEVVMKIRRRNKHRRMFVVNWMEDRSAALELIDVLKNETWNYMYISNMRGILRGENYDDNDVCFIIWKKIRHHNNCNISRIYSSNWLILIRHYNPIF